MWSTVSTISSEEYYQNIMCVFTWVIEIEFILKRCFVGQITIVLIYKQGISYIYGEWEIIIQQFLWQNRTKNII